MTVPAFRRWLQAEIRWLQDHEPYQDDLQLAQDAAHIVDEARRTAVKLGLPNVAKLCESDHLLSLVSAQQVLSGCLAAIGPQSDASANMLTARQLADLLGINLRSVYRRKLDGTLPEPVQVGRSVRWRRSDVEVWLAGN